MTNDTGRPRIGEEMKRMEAEPLAPIEIKLILWSLGLGVAMLILLLLLGDVMFPAPQ